MPRHPPYPHSDHARDRATWWLVFALVVAAGTAWVVAAPLFTGPDEVSQARRAAAVVRGELTGSRHDAGPPLLVDVTVPDLYGVPADDQWRCFLGPLVPGTPQEPMALVPAPCRGLHPTGERVTAATVQYRGQPAFYAFVGLGTLVSDGVPGAYAMRFLGLVAAAAFVASAAVSARQARDPALAGAALLLALTPAVVYLAASTNPSALEIATALSAWAAGMVLIDPTRAPDATVVRRFSVALLVLVVTRGLSPVFGAGLVGVLGALAGRTRVLALGRRRDVRLWGAACLVATGLSLAWLAHIQSAYPLPDRPGSGAVRALGWLPWYLRQSVGVFGTNDSALPPAVAGAWWLLVAALVGLGIAGSPRRVGAGALAVLGAGLALSVTAEGLSLPPIGFFWQGRYALPVLFGALVIATWRAGPLEASAAVRNTSRTVLVGAVTGVHLWAFVVVGSHHADRAGAASTRPTGQTGIATLVGRWAPPLPQAALLVLYVTAVFAVGVSLTTGPGRRPTASPR